MPDPADSRLFRLHGDWCAECLVCRGWVSVANTTRRDARRMFDHHMNTAHSGNEPDVTDHRSPAARFIVRGASYLRGQGTMVLGHLESGKIHCTDELVWFDGTSERRSECRGVSFITEVPMHNPPTMGVIVTNAVPENVHAGTVILAFR